LEYTGIPKETKHCWYSETQKNTMWWACILDGRKKINESRILVAKSVGKRRPEY
jgi:hypothetical protein